MTAATELPHGPIGGGVFPGYECTYGPWPSRTDDEVWPQWVGPYPVHNQTQRDYQERIQRQAEDISETTGFGKVKERKHIMNSPPTTPPHVRTRKMIVDPSRFPKPQASDTKIKKSTASKRPVPRRPITRSTGSARLALHPRKGHVIFRELFQSHVISFETYLQDHDPEKQTPPAESYFDDWGSP
ncbi:hypothetical protein OEA41_001273 [Lepraria neglecta]|uniref:Uncharacterized protein n=1 Tax=Lepraria neglecta TaxID=209136 RepID=A0AAE0DL89_9LECA|nr:hypothetical protein OEA41_001273 [Lepraria neglecta]